MWLETTAVLLYMNMIVEYYLSTLPMKWIEFLSGFDLVS